MDSLNDFDLGPLSWVKAEIDAAFNAAVGVLAGWNGEERTPLKEASTYLHQVSGALQIVELHGVHQVNHAIEDLLTDMAAKPALRNGESSGLAIQSIHALQAYLDGLMAGEANTELALMPTYAAIQTRRGAEAPSPSELFYPDTALRARRHAPEPVIDNDGVAEALRQARMKYQKGLLQLLKSPKSENGLQLMRDAVSIIENLPLGQAQYTFWWAVNGLLEAQQSSARIPEFAFKRVLGRIDSQIRRLREGARQLADRLFRDVLYYVQQAAAPSGRAAEVAGLFELSRLAPKTVRGHDEVHIANLRPQLARLRDSVASAKEVWQRVCAGRNESLANFVESAKQIFNLVEQIDFAPANGLAKALRQTALDLGDAGDALRNEALQVEMATALLLMQHVSENFFALGDDFGEQADLQASRLRVAVSGDDRLLATPDMPLLDEMSRRAQERLLLSQVTQEIKVNLHRAEEILDKFFRDAVERAELPMVPALLKQVEGALSILQLSPAAELARTATERVDQISRASGEVDPGDLNWVAEAISTLGLYVDALRTGRNDPSHVLKLIGGPEEAPMTEMSVEQDIADTAVKLRETANQLTETEATPELREEIKRELARIAQDADLVGDGALRGQADAALRLIADNAAPEEIRGAVQSLSTTPAPAQSAGIPLPADAGELDAELLEIYLEEAKTVLGDIAVRLGRLRENNREHNDFVDIRRGFHTLKGSGRMVGLNDLGEVAWEAEQTLNLWLREERAVNGAILDFIDKMAGAYRGWVEELESRGAAVPHAEDLVAEARRLRGEPMPEPVALVLPRSAAAPATALEPEPIPELTPEVEAEPEPELEPVATPEPDYVRIGHHSLPAPLYDIFSEEAAMRLAELRNNIAELTDESRWQAFARTAHTLAGIARTTGIEPLAEAAHSLEKWVLAWPEQDTPPSMRIATQLAEVVGYFADALAADEQRKWPVFPPFLAERLASMRPEAKPAPEPEEALPGEECDPQLLPIFLAEADDVMPRIGDSLRRWRAEPADVEPGQALRRALHTLKGGARTAGAMRLGDTAHSMESLIEVWGVEPPDAAFLDQLEHEYDTLAEQLDRLRPPAAAKPERRVLEKAAHLSLAPMPEDDAGIRQAFKAKASLLDALINEAGEISISRARIEAALNTYKQTAQELTANVERLRGQLHELEIEAETQIGARMSKLDESHFDPLEFDRYTRLQELTRLMAESVNDVSTAQENMLADLAEVDYALLQQSRTTRGLQLELLHIRMVRLNSQAERLHRIVRQAAKETGRLVHLSIEGGDTELDRSVLDKAMAPFEHLLRNAVFHGIESPEVRRAAGKAEQGELHLAARQEGTDIVLILHDDGGGIDYAKVRARAEALGWLKADEAAERERLDSFLFMPGFTTADQVTQVAGRGVGLDVVRSEIASMGGRVRVESQPGKGTRFTLRVPVTLALAQVVLAHAGDQVYAIPSGMVALVREVRDEDWHDIFKAGEIVLDNQVYPLRSLAELTGQMPQPNEGRQRTVLLLRSGDERVALRVDRLQGNVEAVVKAIGPQLARVPGVAGATVLADGRVALILNPFALMEAAPAEAGKVIESVQDQERAPLILVVDDSLTVRKITTRLLQREGYRVATAKDGIEAIETLQDELPAVMLLDIEMPRMDGFEVARNVRADIRTRSLPIIMITSRTADKHRDHALDLGVNLYMGKPYQESELLAAIAGFLKAPSSAAS
jgi:chemosensory pili system protein ChpA (sensor histidine kinase/response regulator)